MITEAFTRLASTRLVKEIKSRLGTVHFRRWAVMETPLCNVYVHNILQSDQDDPHNHPWPFVSIILWGAYFEERSVASVPEVETRLRTVGSVSFVPRDVFHRIVLVRPTWTIVITGPTHRGDWGYLERWGLFEKFVVDHMTYRERKRARTRGPHH